MADEPESLLLQYMRRLDAKVDCVIDDGHGLKFSITAVEKDLQGFTAVRIESKTASTQSSVTSIVSTPPVSAGIQRMAPASRKFG